MKDFKELLKFAKHVDKICKITDENLDKIVNDEGEQYAAMVSDALAVALLNRTCTELARANGYKNFEAYWDYLSKNVRMTVYESSKARK